MQCQDRFPFWCVGKTLRFQLCHFRRQQLNTNGQAHINQRSWSRELLLLNIQSRSAKTVVNTSSVDEMEGYTCVRGRLCLLPTSHTIADCIACHVCSLAGPPLGCDLCKLPQTSVNEHAKGAQEGGRGEEGEKKKKGGCRDAGENSCTFNYDQEVFTKGWRRCSTVALVNLAPDAVYCVERLLYTIIVHIQLPLQHLICIIGSLMKLALWNKKYKKWDEKSGLAWGPGGWVEKITRCRWMPPQIFIGLGKGVDSWKSQVDGEIKKKKKKSVAVGWPALAQALAHQRQCYK